MTREKLALNHALMIEMVRKSGTTKSDIIRMLKNGNGNDFTPFGDGIPDWQTFIDFYQNHPEKMENAILNGYTITFLTKGALKTLLNIKYGLKEELDYQVHEYHLDNVVLTNEQYNDLQKLISLNWTIVEKQVNDQNHLIRIELTNKPI